MLRCVLSLVKQTQCRRRISHVKKGAVISGEDQRFRGGPNRIDSRILTERELSENVARVHLGSYEVRKTGVSRFDLRDPYHLAVALTWPQFLAGLLAIYLSVNLVFATLPPRSRMLGRVASRTPSSSASKRWRRSATARCIQRQRMGVWSQAVRSYAG